MRTMQQNSNPTTYTHILSQDHVELAALVASSAANTTDASHQLGVLHYDLRVRGGTLEKDMVESRKRLVDVMDIFHSLEKTETDEGTIVSSPITAYFNLTSDSSAEIGLPTTIGRELGFAAHHAIHHMAMVKVIATHTLGFEEGDLPNGFGRAPSTILFDQKLRTKSK